MEFVNPGLLFGLFAIAVPVVIHLFNFRRFRKVYFTNVDFIHELKQETRKQNNLKHLLVLLARMLAVAAIVLAFARPFIPIDQNILRLQDENSISVYIDNSFSMQAESEDGTLLQTALGKAREVASVYKSTDRFQLLTNDFEGRHQRFVSKEEFLDLLDEVEFSPAVKNFDQVRVRQDDLQKSGSAKVKSAYILSDFQEHFLSSERTGGDSLMHTYFVPVQADNTDNLYIDSCWFESPVLQVNQLVKLNVRIKNSSAGTYEDVPVKLTINGVQRALASFTASPDNETIVKLTYTNAETGIQAGVLEINDYPVSFDDYFYFSYRVDPGINVLCIHGESPNFYLNSLFGQDTVIRFENSPVDQLNFSSLQEYQMIILNELNHLSSGLSQELTRFLRAGGSVLVLPPGSFDDDSYGTFLAALDAAQYGSPDTTRQRIGDINLAHPLYAGVFDEIPENMDLPVVNRHFRLSLMPGSKQEALLNLQNGEIFLGIYPVERGRLYLSAVPLDPEYTSFPRHAIFVPTLYKIAVSSVIPHELYYVLGKNEVIRVESRKRSQDEVMKIRNTDGTFEIIPEQRRVGHMEDLFVYEQISEAGNYFLAHSGETVQGLSFNYDRTESEMAFNSPDELKGIIADRQLSGAAVLETAGKPFAQSLADLSRGIQLWKWFVLAALAFLLAEVLLLRFLK
jgi:hypothetical protein